MGIVQLNICSRFKVGDFVWFVTDRDSEGTATTLQRGLVLPEVTAKIDMVKQTLEIHHALQVVKDGMVRTFRVRVTEIVEVITNEI